MVSNVVGIVITPYTTESPKLYLTGNFWKIMEKTGLMFNFTCYEAASGYGKLILVRA
jgi:hypothetical protein